LGGRANQRLSQNREEMDDGYTKIAWVVSSAQRYTKKCIKMARKEKVQLVDELGFAEMLFSVGILDLNKVL